MLKNYFKIAFRSLFKNKSSSLINIGGLATGMTVAMLIGLWIYSELSYNKSFSNHARIGLVWQYVQFGPEKSAYDVTPVPMSEELRTKYPDFQYVSMSAGAQDVLAAGNEKFSQVGSYVEPDFTTMMTVKMLAGKRDGLKDINSILLSQTLANTLFGKADPLNKIITLNNKSTVSVAGVYEDFPENSSFYKVKYLAPWQLYVSNDVNVARAATDWDNNSYQLYVQLKEGADFAAVSAKIKDSRMKRADPPRYKPEFFLHPMDKWYLYGDFKDGANVGGLIQFVWLFGIIGVFVLLLACINFMNLSTARSEKRAREVGIRKAIGSLRGQLVAQFLSESMLVALLSLAFALLLAQLVLPFFNQIAGRKISIAWQSPGFWLAGIGFSLLTGLIAGSYPALYLSSFQPVKVLKGTFKAGRTAALPRKALVVFQFSVSVALVIGTIVVFRQVQYARNRPVGYSRNGLVEININTPELRKNFSSIRNELLGSGAVQEVSASTGSMTVQANGTTDISWRGKAQGSTPLVMGNGVSYEFGKTIGWTLLQGRDLARSYPGDSASILINEAAVKLMGFTNPVGETIRSGGRERTVIGVVKDMVKESPFAPVNPSIFTLGKQLTTIHIRLSPQLSVSEALAKTEPVFKKFNPGSPFTYTFVEDKFSNKFDNEQRIGKLATFFAVLAIFISCLGLFGLASFVAERRTKEIGVRKVLGATIFNVWGLLSKEFVVLVGISLLIAIPVGYYFMHQWLQNYTYRAPLSWWIFAAAAIGALTITLLTVSFQAIRAALINPVKSLRTE